MSSNTLLRDLLEDAKPSSVGSLVNAIAKDLDHLDERVSTLRDNLTAKIESGLAAIEKATGELESKLKILDVSVDERFGTLERRCVQIPELAAEIRDLERSIDTAAKTAAEQADKLDLGPGEVEPIRGRRVEVATFTHPETGETLRLEENDAAIVRAALHITNEDTMGTADAKLRAASERCTEPEAPFTIGSKSTTPPMTSDEANELLDDLLETPDRAEISPQAIEAEATDRVRVGIVGFDGRFLPHVKFNETIAAVDKMQDREILQETLREALRTIRRQERKLREGARE